MKISDNVMGHETNLKEQCLHRLRCSTQMHYICNNIHYIDKNTMDPITANNTPCMLYSSQAAAGRRACGTCTGESGR